MAARHEQVGQRAGDKQAMEVLVQPAIARLGEAEHPLDDPDRMFDPGPHFGLGAVFRPLDLIDNTAVAVAAIGEIASLGRMLPLKPDTRRVGTGCTPEVSGSPAGNG